MKMKRLIVLTLALVLCGIASVQAGVCRLPARDGWLWDDGVCGRSAPFRSRRREAAGALGSAVERGVHFGAAPVSLC